MTTFFGSYIGALVTITLLSAIIERLAFKSLHPTWRAQSTVGTAIIIAAVTAEEFGIGVWTFVAGGALVFLWFRKRYLKASNLQSIADGYDLSPAQASWQENDITHKGQ